MKTILFAFKIEFVIAIIMFFLLAGCYRSQGLNKESDKWMKIENIENCVAYNCNHEKMKALHGPESVRTEKFTVMEF